MSVCVHLYVGISAWVHMCAMHVLCMYTHACLYARTPIYVHVRTACWECVHTCAMNVCTMCTRSWCVYTCVHMHSCVHIGYMYTRVHAHACVWSCELICVCVCCVHTCEHVYMCAVNVTCVCMCVCTRTCAVCAQVALLSPPAPLRRPRPPCSGSGDTLPPTRGCLACSLSRRPLRTCLEFRQFSFIFLSPGGSFNLETRFPCLGMFWSCLFGGFPCAGWAASMGIACGAHVLGSWRGAPSLPGRLALRTGSGQPSL